MERIIFLLIAFIWVTQATLVEEDVQNSRLRRDVIVAQRRVKRPRLGEGGREEQGERKGEGEEEEYEVKKEGRHLHIVQDLLLKLQCLELGCNNDRKRAKFCCERNVNINCCAYHSHYTPTSVWIPLFSPAVYHPTPAPPPIVPVYSHHHQDHEEDHYHQQDEYHSNHEEDYHHHHELGPHDIYEGSLHPLHVQKPGSCPHEDDGYYEEESSYYPVGRDLLLHSHRLGPDCSHDTDCGGDKKCCHARVSRHRLVMTCRLPDELYNGSYYPWRTGKGILLEEEEVEG